jgi:exodeoxyribonuclease VII large subunit
MPIRPPIPGSSATFAEREIYSVSRLNREVRLLLDHGMPTLWVEGEVSNFSRPASGHWYFSLKDRDAQVRCAMFRGRNAVLRFTPKDGQRVVARVRVGLYEPRGEYQLQVEHLEEAGVGALRREFEQLYAKLEKEGLFDRALKRALPAVPTTIGVITSPTGAALRDILNILGRRFPAARIVLYPSVVQGQEAVGQLRAALADASRRNECDVLILARGGGSLEDLWAFNDEVLARAIRLTPMPVVTGIGHEIDFTIADFVADLRAPTPSGAAELVVPDAALWRQSLARLHLRIAQIIQRQLRDDGHQLVAMQKRLRLAHPGQRLLQRTQRLDELEQRLHHELALRLGHAREQLGEIRRRLGEAKPTRKLLALQNRHALLDARLRELLPQRLQLEKSRLAMASRTLDAVSPLATLERGYAIVTRIDDRHVLREASEVRVGDPIEARLRSGSIRARVTALSADDDKP